MVRQSEDFRLAWTALSQARRDNGWQAISVSPSGPVELRAGMRSPDGAESLLVGFPSARLPPAEKLPDGQGFLVERVEPDGNQGLWLALTRRVNGPPALFTDMVCNVAGALDAAVVRGVSEAALLRTFIGRVRAWQDFMRKGAQPLGPEAEVGLAGELTVLGALMDAGVPAQEAVHAWVGPLDQAQDFQLGSGAIEVKSTLSTLGFPATIGSLEQLDDSVRQPLYLAGVRLRQTEAGQTLPELVSAILARLCAAGDAEGLFRERLLSARFHEPHAVVYTRRFAPVDLRILEVGPQFPRLVGGNVPAGVSKAVYQVDLDRITTSTQHELASALKQLGVI